MAKKRLDVAMVEQGLAESRQKAQAVIMAGQVYVNGQKVDKAGAPVTEDAAIEVRGKTLRPERLCLCRYRGLHRCLFRLHAAERSGDGLRRGRRL